VLRYTARTAARPEVAWSLLAQPDRWPDWAPHLRGAWGLGEPEVRAGARGAARLLGVLPIPARVSDKHPGRAWTWRVGPVEIAHGVEPRGGGAEVIVELSAPAPLESLLRITYGPLVTLLVANLARVAERERQPQSSDPSPAGAPGAGM
jgi:hypothetical protein